MNTSKPMLGNMGKCQNTLLIKDQKFNGSQNIKISGYTGTYS